MKAKDFLQQYERAERRVRRLEQELHDERLMIDAVRSLSDNDGLPHGSGISKPVEARAIRLADKLLELSQARLDAVQIRREVFDVVQQIDDAPGDVLFARYIKLMTWEHVAEYVHYSIPWTHRLHKAGLVAVEEILRNNESL